MSYELIAFDMDGTLLDSTKKVLPSSVEAIDAAQAAGKHVAICSGRCPIMIDLYKDDLPASVQFAICSSGASLYDLQAQQVLEEFPISRDTVAAMLGATDDLRIGIEGFVGRAFYANHAFADDLSLFGLGVYQPMYDALATKVDDIREVLLAADARVTKINFHLMSLEDRATLESRIKDLPVELAYSEGASLEASPAGIDKGVGLLALAKRLGIDGSATIGVGDADNDLAMLRAAGLGVAMGNANKNAVAAADVQVNDNDHDGCAQAVWKYLLA